MAFRGVAFDDQKFQEAYPHLLSYRVKELSLQHTSVSDASIPLIAGLRHLRILHISGSVNMTAGGIKQLGECPKLRTLYLQAADYSAQELAEIRNELPDVKVYVSLLKIW